MRACDEGVRGRADFLGEKGWSWKWVSKPNLPSSGVFRYSKNHQLMRPSIRVER